MKTDIQTPQGPITKIKGDLHSSIFSAASRK